MAGYTRAELQSYARTQRPEYERVLKEIVEIPSVSVEPQRKGDTRRAAEYAASVRGHGGDEAAAGRGTGLEHRSLQLRAPG